MADTLTAATSLYRYYDGRGVLLYVGITARGVTRNLEHTSKEWWSFVASQGVEHFDHRTSAERRERELIQRLRPPFNIVHNVDPDGARAGYYALLGDVPDETFDAQFRRVGPRLPLSVGYEMRGRDLIAVFRPWSGFYPLAESIAGRRAGRAPIVQGSTSVGQILRCWDLGSASPVFEGPISQKVPAADRAFARLRRSNPLSRRDGKPATLVSSVMLDLPTDVIA